MSLAVQDVEARIQAVIEKKPELSGAVVAKLEELLADLENLSVEEQSEGQSAFDKLKNGFESFKKQVYLKNSELTSKLKTGQWPKFMIIACADSRVCPTQIFNLSPGDAFVIRNVANVVPAYEKEGNPSVGCAVEYAVLHLKVDHILVIGHRACGGIGALVKMVPDDGAYKTTFIEKWMEIGKPARAIVKEQCKDESIDVVCKTCEKESVNNSLSNLMSYPFVEEAVNQGKVSLHGGYYDHIEGSFHKWDFNASA
ncbi:hypothetical protein Mapa_015540 [Marchantia paleacea]|nr:hypothetical protein Mapa_015540 [Marchantia paleacea]